MAIPSQFSYSKGGGGGGSAIIISVDAYPASTLQHSGLHLGGGEGGHSPPLSRALPPLRFTVMDDMVQLATAEYAKQMIFRKSLCAYVD